MQVPRVDARLRVRYAETDQMGVVYHAHYLVWMEMGRTELCRVNGVRYRDMEEQEGILLTVAEVNCRYHAAARYDDDIVVSSWIAESHPRMITFAYEIRHAESGLRLASGSTKHVFCSRELKPTKLPPKFFPLFGIKR